MKKELSTEDIKEIAAQLSCPSGENGVKIGNMMNETNVLMTINTVNSLELKDKENILEIGHGNCSHLTTLLQYAKGLSYSGLDISELMKKEAEMLNFGHIKKNVATFQLYDGVKIPFKDANFHKIFTVNTIYFWKKPVLLLNEIYRVLKTGGQCSIAFAKKSFMEKLPFTAFGFKMYSAEDIRNLIKHTPFELVAIVDDSDQVKSKTDELVTREFSIVILKK
ncbi:MAG: class I SAM-dependent methyltransferase [Cellulophaga sp.]